MAERGKITSFIRWLILAIVPVLLGTAAQVADRASLPLWAVLLLFSLSIVAYKLRQRKRTLQSILEFWPLCRVCEVESPYKLGVFNSTIASSANRAQGIPPYIPREVDADIDHALKSKRFIVISGKSAAGKSRSAFEAILRVFPDRKVIAPLKYVGALQKLAALELPIISKKLVLWLDDVIHDLRPGDLTLGILRQLQDQYPDLRTIATISSDEPRALPVGRPGRHRDNASPDSETSFADSPATEFRAKPLFSADFTQRIELKSELSDSELADAKRLYPKLAENPLLEAMGEYFVGADKLVEKLQQEKECPGGVAVVRAVIDWARVGMRRPIPRDVLKELSKDYFEEITGKDFREKDFDSAVDWGRTKVNSSAALIVRANSGAFRPFDYIVEWADKKGRDVPDATWRFVVGKAEPDEKLEIGLSAYIAGKPDLAEQIWETTEEFKDPKWAFAAVTLGDLRAAIGNLDRARSSYQVALGSKHPDYAPRAALGLGHIYLKKRDFKEARSSYQYVIDSKHIDYAPTAALALGHILQEQGDFEGAQSALKFVVKSGHADLAPKAFNDLGVLYKKINSPEQAKEAFQQAIDSGHAEAMPVAALNLGSLLADVGDIEEAKSAYQRAIDSGHPDYSPYAAFQVAGLYEKTDEIVSAKNAYQYAIDSGHPQHAPASALGLGLILSKEGNIAGAREAYKLAMRSPNPEVASSAKELLEE